MAFKIKSGMIYSVIVALILATVLVQMMPSLTPSLMLGVHNATDSIADSATTIGISATLVSLIRDGDVYFVWGMLAGLLLFLIRLGMSVWNFGSNLYRSRGFKRYR